MLTLTPRECQTSSNLFTYFAAKLKPGRFPYLEDEARQVSLFGGRSQAGFLIWNSTLYTHEKRFGTSYPSIFSPSLKI